MTRNETVFTDENGISRVIHYRELDVIDGKVVCTEWKEHYSKPLKRKPNDDEIAQVESEQNTPEEVKQIPQSAVEAFADKLNDPAVNSIDEVKDALKDFIAELK